MTIQTERASFSASLGLMYDCGRSKPKPQF